VRDSRGGVLVVSGCTVGSVVCRLREPGPVLLVQPCDANRDPICPAVRVGPIRSEDDIAEVRDWLRGGRLDPASLPAHLTALHRAAGAATSN
jgi:hypothetical protein